MTLRVNGYANIENLRNHSPETVEKLRALLADGAPARPDPRREGFFEVENCNQVYYIHVDDGTDRVYLLATWQKDAPPKTANAPAITPTTEARVRADKTFAA